MPIPFENAPTVIWITGAGGLIGGELVRSAPKDQFPNLIVRGIQRNDLDLNDSRAINAFLEIEQPAAVIHCAAISKSPVCDANRDLALRTNVEATRRLVEGTLNAHFIFFSTDLIFDGRKGSYREDDEPNPLMFYAETKVLAEEVVRKHPRHLIIRTSLTGGHSETGDRGFNEDMKRAWRAGKKLSLFTDEYRCPLAAEVTAKAVWELCLKGATGTYHLCGGEKLSRYEIGALLRDHHPELDCRIEPGFRKDYTGPPRPADTSLNIDKIQQALSFQIPRFSDWIRHDRSGF